MRSADDDATRVPGTAWAGYAACVWGLIFAAVSFYWGSGGRRGLDTVGGSLEKDALNGDVAIYLTAWAAGLLKVIAAGVALALVRPWGARLPRRVVVVLGWIAAVVTGVYGAVQVAAGALVETHAITPSTPVDWKPLRWHLWLWDMSFLIWGVLFAVALWGFSRRTRVSATVLGPTVSRPEHR